MKEWVIEKQELYLSLKKTTVKLNKSLTKIADINSCISHIRRKNPHVYDSVIKIPENIVGNNLTHNEVNSTFEVPVAIFGPNSLFEDKTLKVKISREVAGDKIFNFMLDSYNGLLRYIKEVELPTNERDILRKILRDKGEVKLPNNKADLIGNKLLNNEGDLLIKIPKYMVENKSASKDPHPIISIPRYIVSNNLANNDPNLIVKIPDDMIINKLPNNDPDIIVKISKDMVGNRLVKNEADIVIKLPKSMVGNNLAKNESDIVIKISKAITGNKLVINEADLIENKPEDIIENKPEDIVVDEVVESLALDDILLDNEVSNTVLIDSSTEDFLTLEKLFAERTDWEYTALSYRRDQFDIIEKIQSVSEQLLCCMTELNEILMSIL